MKEYTIHIPMPFEEGDTLVINDKHYKAESTDNILEALKTEGIQGETEGREIRFNSEKKVMETFVSGHNYIEVLEQF